LTAETVVPGLEDAEAYRALEAALAADYDPATIVERQLAARLASLLWRLRRTALIECGIRFKADTDSGARRTAFR
jgi:hypothetical protein